MGRTVYLHILLLLSCSLLFQGCEKSKGLDEVSNVPFVVKTTEDVKLLKSNGFYLNAENVAASPEATEGACGIGTFNIDFGEYVESKYYNAVANSWTWLSVWDVVLKENADIVVTDTIALKKGGSVIDEILFISGAQTIAEDKEYVYELSYDMSQHPVNNNYRVDLNIFVKGGSKGSSPHKETRHMAFNLAEFFEKYDTPGRPDTFNITVKFSNGWTEDYCKTSA